MAVRSTKGRLSGASPGCLCGGLTVEHREALPIGPVRQEIDMKFGLFQSVQLPEPGAQAKYYKEALEQVR